MWRLPGKPRRVSPGKNVDDAILFSKCRGARKLKRGLAEMGRRIVEVLYLVVMVALIVGVDFAFFRHRFFPRLIVNIGIVLVFAAFYLRFLRRR